MKYFPKLLVPLALLMAILMFTFVGTVSAKTTQAAVNAQLTGRFMPACGWTRVDDQPIYAEGTYAGHTIMWKNTCTNTGHEETVATISHYSIHAGIWSYCNNGNLSADGYTQSIINTAEIHWVDGCMEGDGLINGYPGQTYG